LKGVNQNVVPTQFEGETGQYALLNVHIYLRRRTGFFAFNLVFPCFIISILCALGFALPANSKEKLVLEITNLLAIIFFTQFISTITPASSLAVPRICEIIFCFLHYFLNKI
jgi:nicotinic acetylcholine receptor